MNKALFSIMANLQTHHHLSLDFQKKDQQIGGKWLSTVKKRRMGNQLHRLELPCEIKLSICETRLEIVLW